MFSSDVETPIPWIAAGILSTIFLHKKVLRGDVALFLEGTLFLAIILTHHFVDNANLLASCSLATSAIFWHITSITLATIAYRLSPFHPLWNFKGPLINKITSFAMLYVVWTGKRHLYIDALHRKYGKFVRTGPNTLSINSHEAIGPIYASASALDKSAAYTPGRLKGTGLFFIRSKADHNTRRRLWAGAFTPQALEEDKSVLEKRTFELKTCVRDRRDTGGIVDLGEAIQHWSYAVMGDLTFGGSDRLELMRDGDPEGLVESGHKATLTFECLGEVPSVFDILSYFPVTGKLKRLEKVAEELLAEREKENRPHSTDIVSHLLGHHSFLSPLNLLDRRIDTLFAIQAGSDTTSTVIIYLLFLVISNKHAYERLREELDANFSDPDEPISISALGSLPYLNAVVNEALRLGSPFPGWPRVTPKGGMVIADTYIPGEMIVGVNPYVQGTSGENFYPDPTAYKPERWLPGGLGPGTLTRKSAIVSFSFGAFGCLGRNLAILELQIVTVRLMLAFDFALPSTFDTSKFLDGVENMRTTHFRYPLKVIATPRV